MAIDDRVKAKANQIRNEIYGKDVREALASSLELMSNEIDYDIIPGIERYISGLESSGTLMANKGIDFPMMLLSEQWSSHYRNAFLDIKVFNATKGAQYRLNHVSKNATEWGGLDTFLQFGKSMDGGKTWELSVKRNSANLPNNQTGIKTHVITVDEIDEVFSVTMDWEAFEDGAWNSTMGGNSRYIIHPSNYHYLGGGTAKEPYMDNKGKVFPFKMLSGEPYARLDNTVLDMKVHRADEFALYRLYHISKDNTAWGAPLTFIGIEKSVDNGVNWDFVVNRNQANLPNNLKGIQTHNITHSEIDEVFSITLDWDNMLVGSNNFGPYSDYIISPVNYFFRKASGHGAVNDLEDNIVIKKDGRTIQVKHKLNDKENIIVIYKKLKVNEFHEMGQFVVQPNTVRDSNFDGKLVMSTATDFVSPYGLKSVNNPVSNNSGSITVGGAHGTEGGSGFPTGRFGKFVSIKLDNSDLREGISKGKKLDLIVEHYVSGSNVVNKTTGAKRDTMKETRTYSITSRSHKVHVKVTALEKLELTRYTGLQLTQPDFYHSMYRYDNGTEGVLPVKGLSEGFHIAEEKDYKKLDRAVLFNDTSMLVMLTDRNYGIGDGHLAPKDTPEYEQAPINITGGAFGKIYSHNLGRNNNSVILEVGESLQYRGGYYFVEDLKGIEDISIEGKLLTSDHWINFTGNLTPAELNVYGPFTYKPGMYMNNANYVSYFDSNGDFIKTVNVLRDDNFEAHIPEVSNAKTIKISIWHHRLSAFKLRTMKVENVFEYLIDGVRHVDDLR